MRDTNRSLAYSCRTGLLVTSMLFSFLSEAQLNDIIVEEYGTGGGNYPAGHTTYRVYVRLEDSSDFLASVYGTGAAANDPNHTLIICDNIDVAGSTTCWNSGFGGVTGPNINPALCGAFPEVCYDSFVTIGRASMDDPGGSINVVTNPPGALNPTFANSSTIGVPSPVDDGLWFALPGDINGFPTGVDNRVLIMQITCPTGSLQFQINLQILDNGSGQNPLYYCHTNEDPGGSIGGVPEIESCILAYPTNPACEWGFIYGCTDPVAENYNPEATTEDGSCFYLNAGCIYSKAINYDPLANYNDGSCLFAGCNDPLANNFNPYANFNDGTCNYTFECPGDFNEDGTIGTGDILILIGNYGVTCED